MRTILTATCMLLSFGGLLAQSQSTTATSQSQEGQQNPSSVTSNQQSGNQATVQKVSKVSKLNVPVYDQRTRQVVKQEEAPSKKEDDK